MSPKINSLVGNIYNDLTVLSLHSTKPVKYVCKCVCGKTPVVVAGHLVSNHTKSCGCRKIRSARKQNFKNLLGKRFGRLQVMSRGENYAGGARWWCVCDCGRVSLVQSNSLLEGTIVSCGCYGKEQRRNANTTHGLSNTKEYVQYQCRKRLELKRILDTAWTIDMEIGLRDFYKKCILCGATENLCIDHVKPLSKGYGLRPGNAVILCNSCNASKNNKDLEELDPKAANIILEEAMHFNVFWNRFGD